MFQIFFLLLVSNYHLDLSNCHCSRDFRTIFLFQHSLNKVIRLINVWLYCNPDCDLWCSKAHHSNLGRVSYVETKWCFVFILWFARLVATFTRVCSNVCDTMLFVCPCQPKSLYVSPKPMDCRLSPSVCVRVWICDNTERASKPGRNLFYSIIWKRCIGYFVKLVGRIKFLFVSVRYNPYMKLSQNWLITLISCNITTINCLKLFWRKKYLLEHNKIISGCALWYFASSIFEYIWCLQVACCVWRRCGW
jgi:hypothetical protein